MKHEKLRKEIAASCLDMNNRGINQGTSGNISARVPRRLPADAVGHSL
jgi:Ribulose-5-phosphate 4-epimerase and related epimerases and aldolases